MAEVLHPDFGVGEPCSVDPLRLHARGVCQWDCRSSAGSRNEFSLLQLAHAFEQAAIAGKRRPMIAV